ncbi:hypothetical protein V8E52_008521 [Russula decolorans]
MPNSLVLSCLTLVTTRPSTIALQPGLFFLGGTSGFFFRLASRGSGSAGASRKTAFAHFLFKLSAIKRVFLIMNGAADLICFTPPYKC